MTTRWTQDERSRLSWLSEHLCVDISNVPRTLLWQHFANNPDLQNLYQTGAPIKEVLPKRTYSTDSKFNDEVTTAVADYCNSIEEVNRIVQSALNNLWRDRMHVEEDGYDKINVEYARKRFIEKEFGEAVLQAIEEHKRTIDSHIEMLTAEQLSEYNTPIEDLFGEIIGSTTQPKTLGA